MTALIDSWPMLIGGETVDTGEWTAVHSPWSGEVVSNVAWGDADSARRAIAAAATAMATPLAARRRSEILQRISELVADSAEQLAGIVSREAGKPLKAARMEIERAASTFAIAAAEALRITGETIALPETEGLERTAFTVRRPVGVVAAITPFNFPLNLVAHKVAPALAAGCAVVVKPADKAPGAALRLAQIALEAGLPSGWLNVVLGPPGDLAETFARDDRVRLISFTGSARVGWELAARASRKRVTLELGNSSPVLVEPDADIALAAAKVVQSGYGFSGQTCISAQRVYVHRSRYEELLAELAPLVRALRVGDPADAETDVGPVVDEQAALRLEGWIAEAVTAGARLLVGGDRDGAVLSPALLTDVAVDSPLAVDEAFGPVVAIWPYDSFDDAIRSANATAYGLHAAVFTYDMRRILAAVERLDFGGVIVNDAPSFRRDEMPYGGVKASGNTREGPARAIREMTEEHLVVLAGQP